MNAVERRPVAGDGDDRPVGKRHLHPGRGGEGEAEPALRGAQVPERLAGREAIVDVRPVDGRLLDHDRVPRQALGQRGQDMARGQRLTGGGWLRGGRGRARLGRRSVSLRDGGGQLTDHRRDRGEHTQLRGAAVHLVRVVAHDGDPRAGLGESSRDEAGLPEGRSADDEHRVVGGELAAKPGAVRGEHSLVGRVILREACPPAERLLEDGRAELLGELDERRPCRRVVRAGADDERRPLGGGEEGGEGIHRLGIGAARAQHRASRGGGLALLVGGLAPVAHRHDHEGGSPARRGGVVGALDRGRHVVRGGRGLDRHGVRARQPVQPPGQERLVGEVPPVLLADDDDQRRAVDTRGREAAHARAEPRRRVQQDERRLAPGDRVAARHPDHGALVQAEDEAQVVGQAGQERDLGRARIGEHRRQPAAAEEVEGRVADEPGHWPCIPRVVNPADLGVIDAAAALARRELSSRELTEACLDRIAERDGTHSHDGDPASINAWVRVYEDDARAAAAAADERLARGDAPLLCGVPIGLKDLYAVAGKPLTASSRVLADVPERDCDVWARLRAEGMVLLGHLHTHEFACGGTTDQVGNPWALERSAGGSSGGSSAALASNQVAAATGTDTAGSLRIPSSECGTSTIKPTHGLVSQRGIVPLAPTFDHPGPMTRAVRDCEPLLAAMAGRAAARRAPPAPAAGLSRRGSPTSTPTWPRASSARSPRFPASGSIRRLPRSGSTCSPSSSTSSSPSGWCGTGGSTAAGANTATRTARGSSTPWSGR